MKQHLVTLMFFTFFLASCGIQTNVMHSGQYNALPESEVADTGLYPMKHFILVEEDGLSGKTFVYLFSGDLAAAGIGIEDLDRIVRHHRLFEGRSNRFVASVFERFIKYTQ